MALFLSQTWFDEVHTLNTTAGELHLPPTLADLVLNATIEQDAPALLHLKDGKIHQGHADNAKSHIIIDGDILKRIAQTGESDLAIEAFMIGKIRIEGDMSTVMALQSAKPSPEQKALFKQILAMSEF